MTQRHIVIAVGACALLLVFLAWQYLPANANSRVMSDGSVLNTNQSAAATDQIFLPLVAKDAAAAHQIFLPLVMKNYFAPAPLWRFGITKARRSFLDYNAADVAAMRFGWYLDYAVTGDPVQPYGIEYTPIVRVKQLKRAADGSATECCVGCSYWTPYAYTVSPSVSQIQSAALSRPGMTWAIGNEIERIDGGVGYCGRQDEILPELYAQAYHDLYYAIKNADPTAQVAIGGMVEFTDLRQQYLDRIWAEYPRLYYGQTMPVEIWNIHVYVLQISTGMV